MRKCAVCDTPLTKERDATRASERKEGNITFRTEQARWYCPKCKDWRPHSRGDNKHA